MTLTHVREVYSASNGVFADLKAADATKFNVVFGDTDTAPLDLEFMTLAGERLTPYTADERPVVAAMIWFKFFATWNTFVSGRENIDLEHNMDYTITTDGNNSQTEQRSSTQNTDSDSYGFGSDAAANEKDSEQTTSSNGQVDTTIDNVVTYKGRNGGDRIGDYKALYNFNRATVDNMISDLIEFLTIPLYDC